MWKQVKSTVSIKDKFSLIPMFKILALQAIKGCKNTKIKRKKCADFPPFLNF